MFLLEEYRDIFDSPFVVPVAACVMALGMSGFGAWSSARKRELQSQERLAAIAKGMPLPPTPDEIAAMHGRPGPDVARRRANVRLWGMIMLGLGLGMVLFFIALAAVLQVRPVLSGAAAGLIPLGIGIALLIDVRLQRNEASQVDAAAETSSGLIR
jgi:hypothetical protein